MSAHDLRSAARAVALAKLNEWRRQCDRLAGLVRQGVIDKAEAIDALADIAAANGLVVAHGEALIQSALAEAFRDSDFSLLRSEVA